MLRVPGVVKAFAYAAPLVGLACLLAWQAVWPLPAITDHEAWTLPAVFAALEALAIMFPLHFTRSHKLAINDAVHIAALLMFGPTLATLCVGVGALGGYLVLLSRRRRGVRDVLFGVGKAMLAVAFGGFAYHLLVPLGTPFVVEQLSTLVALPGAVLALFLGNTLPTAVIISLQHERSMLDVWRAGRRVDGMQTIGLYLVGLMAAATVPGHPWAAVVMVLPTAPIYVSLKRTVQFLDQQLDEQTIVAVESMADTVDLRDVTTIDHSKRVANYAVQIAERMGLSASQVATIRMAARVHDLGNIGVPDHVLKKSGPLAPEEREQVVRHVEIGYEILSRFVEFRECRELVRQHHEHYDGTGYPGGLKGDAVMVGAQVVAVADALDAMTNERPYRRALAMEAVLGQFQAGRGRQWHPGVVDAADAVLRGERRVLDRDRDARLAVSSV